jgi:hypothetical protein
MAGGLCRLGSPGQRGGEELPPDSACPPPPPPLVDSGVGEQGHAAAPTAEAPTAHLCPPGRRARPCPPPRRRAASPPAGFPSSRSRPRTAGLELELLHGQVRACKSTAKSGDQKPAAPPPKCYGSSLVKFFSEKNKIEGNFSFQFL